jgi:predicted ATPase with chaperone activity
MKKIFIIIILVIISLGAQAQAVDSLSLAIARTESILDSMQNKVINYQKAMENPYTNLSRQAQIDILDMFIDETKLFEKFLECFQSLQEYNKTIEVEKKEIKDELDFMIMKFNEMAKLAKEIAAENKELREQIHQ